jgi:hypothetical protein
MSRSRSTTRPHCSSPDPPLCLSSTRSALTLPSRGRCHPFTVSHATGPSRPPPSSSSSSSSSLCVKKLDRSHHQPLHRPPSLEHHSVLVSSTSSVIVPPSRRTCLASALHVSNTQGEGHLVVGAPLAHHRPCHDECRTCAAAAGCAPM